MPMCGRTCTADHTPRATLTPTATRTTPLTPPSARWAFGRVLKVRPRATSTTKSRYQLAVTAAHTTPRPRVGRNPPTGECGEERDGEDPGLRVSQVGRQARQVRRPSAGGLRITRMRRPGVAGTPRIGPQCSYADAGKGGTACQQERLG